MTYREKCKAFLFVGLLAAAFAVCTDKVSAQVTTTKEPTGNAESIYVAGNPDLYPIEYFNEKTGCYEGVFPEILERISRQTGKDFVYVSGGKKNLQKNLGENCQVEIVSVHVTDELQDEESRNEVLLCSIDTEDGKKQVSISFTEIADPVLKEQIQEAVDQIKEEELMEMILSYVMENEREKEIPVFLMIAFAVLGAAAAGCLISWIKFRNRQTQQEMDRMKDPLTGIGNAEFLAYFFEHFITDQAAPLYYLAYIGIRNLEQIRQYQGNDELNELQRYFAAVLSEQCRDHEAAVRLDDGVFMILLQCSTEENARTILNEILEKLNAYTEKFRKEYHIIVHLGVYQLEEQKGSCEMAVLQAKQGYLYAVKNKMETAFVNQRMLKDMQQIPKLKLEIQDALKRHEFRLYLQFIVDARTKKICGAEGLSRWQNPREGIVSPGKYIELLHKAGMIEKLDYYILEESCKQLEEWKKQNLGELRLSCNFTRTTISDEDFLTRFGEIVTQYDFRHDRLWMEITEDAISDNDAMVQKNISECRKMGFYIVMDDFGSGYSSLKDLADYSFDCVKVDRQIIRKSVEPRGRELLRGISRLVHELGMELLCEGVENEEENQAVEEIPCEYIQGYYYSRVFPKEFAMEYYQKYMADLE
ncbi:MAG: EAL domain-containing protein [Bariatricus sp.]